MLRLQNFYVKMINTFLPWIHIYGFFIYPNHDETMHLGGSSCEIDLTLKHQEHKLFF